ncbi:MAG: DUF1801 domain-containing protein [Anaerolineaceae bacterium]|nr:DUF1801 domain-containing protein [Anaerolineaceae bacterium]
MENPKEPLILYRFVVYSICYNIIPGKEIDPMNPVNDFLSNFDGEKREWLLTFISFMRENYPEIPETISYQIPTYKFNKKYIAFSVAKDHFSFHSLDFEMIESLKSLLPKAKFAKGCAKVNYKDREYIPILFDMCKIIVERNASAPAK